MIPQQSPPSSHYFSCSIHPSQKVNNFCNSPQCLLPLCSTCIVDHVINHYKQGQIPELLDFQSVRDKCIARINHLRSSLTDSLRQIQKTYGELPISLQGEIQKIRKSREDVNSLIETFYDDILHKANFSSDSLKIKLQKLLEEVQILEGKIQGEEYPEAIKCFYNRNFEQEINDAQASSLIKAQELAQSNIRVEINYDAFERVRKELTEFIHVAQDAKTNEPEFIAEVPNTAETADQKSSESSKYSPSSNVGSQGKGKDSHSSVHQKTGSKKVSSEKYPSQYLTPPQEHQSDQVSTDVKNNDCETGESGGTHDSPSNSQGIISSGGRKSVVSDVVPRSLNFTDSGLKHADENSNGLMENSARTEFSFNQGMEVEAAVPSTKADLLKSQDDTKKDPLARFRQKFDQLKNRPVATTNQFTTDSDDLIGAGKRRGFSEIEKDEPELMKQPKLESKFSTLSFGSSTSLLDREPDFHFPIGSRFISDTKSDFMDGFSAIRQGKSSVAYSNYGSTGPRRNLSCLTSLAKDDKFLIDESRLLMDDNYSISSPCQLSQHDLDTSMMPNYYLIENFEETESNHYQKKDCLSTKDKSQNDGDILNMDQDFSEKESSQSAPKKEPIPSSFNINLPNYFNPDAKAKLLHFFQWRSKNLHIVSVDALEANTGNLKFTTIPLTMDTLIHDYHCSLITPDGEIYMMGGRLSKNNRHRQSSDIYTVDIQEKRLIKKSSMLVKRDSHAICYTSGYIYIIGGITFDNENRPMVSRMCERYNVATNQSYEIAQAPLPVSNHSACVFQDNYIFCFGGRHKPNKLSNNILRYNIEKNAWLCLNLKTNSHAKLNFGLTSQGNCCQINDGHIFIFGGYHENRAVSDQSFLFSYLSEAEESLFTKFKSQSQELQKEEAKNKGVWVIKGLNNKKVCFPAPFWDKQTIVQNGKIYCLQNAVSVNDPRVAYSNNRRVLMFDGNKWSSLV